MKKGAMLLLTSSLLIALLADAYSQNIYVQPGPVKVKQGESISLWCKMKGDSDTAVPINWQSPPNFRTRTSNCDSFVKEKYGISCAESRIRWYNITIMDVKWADRGNYRCIRTMYLGIVDLQVLVPVTNVYLNNTSKSTEEPLLLSEDINAVLTCTTNCAFPAPKIEWFENEQPFNGSANVNNTEFGCTGEKEGQKRTISTVTVIGKYADKGRKESSIVCEAENVIGEPKVSAAIDINYNVDPRLPQHEVSVEGTVVGVVVAVLVIAIIAIIVIIVVCRKRGKKLLPNLSWCKHNSGSPDKVNSKQTNPVVSNDQPAVEESMTPMLPQYPRATSTENKLEDNDTNIDDNHVTVKELYGWLIGFWQLHRGDGGLICVKEKSDCLEGRIYYANHPTYVNLNLESKLVFTVEMCDGEALALCRAGILGEETREHRVQLTQGENGDLCVKCQSPEKHQLNTDHVLEGGSLDDYVELAKMLPNLGCEYECQMIQRLRKPHDAVVQPGFFQGNYFQHGVEILKLGYSAADSKQLEIRKVTGDQIIPAGHISMKVYLLKPMILKMEQQEAFGNLIGVDLLKLDQVVQLRELPQQPFMIPNDYTGHRSKEIPETCKLRFCADGQVAEDNFTKPHFVPGHFIVFDENTFGFLWIEHRNFTLLKRCREKDLA